MKWLLIKIIKLYQGIPSNIHMYCRHYPTCSSYAIDAINEYGSIKGSLMALKRIIRCNPLGTKGYDPVIKNKRSIYEEDI